MTEAQDNLEKAYALCRKQAEHHYENFPVGSFLLPKQQRTWIHAIYAYARTADDFADENIGELTEHQRLELLKRWEDDLDRSLAGEARGTVFVALERAIREARLDVQLLRDLLSAFRQDVTKRRYGNFTEVLDYCRRSANPVGRLVLQVFNYRDEERAALSDHICTALQLTNFWQDISVDIKKDRVYLPLDDMAQFGVGVDDLRHARATTRVKSLIKFQCERTWDFFKKGKPLCNLLDSRLRWEIRMTWLGGTQILRMIRAQDYDTLWKRPTLSKWKMFMLLLRALRRDWDLAA